MPKMDSIDQRILTVLQERGRISNHDLAQEVGLSESPCLRRVKHLEAEGIIERYVAIVRPQSVGLAVNAFVRVRLRQQDDEHLARFEIELSRIPEVMECYLMTGDSDYQLRVLVPSLNSFEEFLREKLTTISGIAEVTTGFALRSAVYKTALPI